ncbi:hypothetical protein MTR_8g099925 [Medicago truncatula]|uniref:Uncharacterized protein n=1 Tax=Medicago truncatula TaxID=3880 RepID=A0A072TVU2_MEDTR|nr:hypothetical protein MTR_8g099925 [Medicago truncatula]
MFSAKLLTLVTLDRGARFEDIGTNEDDDDTNVTSNGVCFMGLERHATNCYALE